MECIRRAEQRIKADQSPCRLDVVTPHVEQPDSLGQPTIQPLFRRFSFVGIKATCPLVMGKG